MAHCISILICSENMHGTLHINCNQLWEHAWCTAYQLLSALRTCMVHSIFQVCFESSAKRESVRDEAVSAEGAALTPSNFSNNWQSYKLHGMHRGVDCCGRPLNTSWSHIIYFSDWGSAGPPWFICYVIESCYSPLWLRVCRSTLNPMLRHEVMLFTPVTEGLQVLLESYVTSWSPVIHPCDWGSAGPPFPICEPLMTPSWF